MAVENKGDINQYIWWSTTSLEEWSIFFRNDYKSREFTKFLDWKDQKGVVNLDSGKTCQSRSISIVGKYRNDMGMVNMPVNLPIKLKTPFSLPGLITSWVLLSKPRGTYN